MQVFKSPNESLGDLGALSAANLIAAATDVAVIDPIDAARVGEDRPGRVLLVGQRLDLAALAGDAAHQAGASREVEVGAERGDLDAVSFTIGPRSRIGVIAPNGTVAYSYSALDPDKHVENTLTAVKALTKK